MQTWMLRNVSNFKIYFCFHLICTNKGLKATKNVQGMVYVGKILIFQNLVQSDPIGLTNAANDPLS